MSLRAMLWALEEAPCAEQGPLLVLIALAERADETGRNAWPSVAWMAQRARCSERTVQRHLGWLKDHGLIREGDQRLVDHLRADRRPTVYDLSMGRGDSLTPRTSDGVTAEVPRGDSGDVHGVTTVSPNTSPDTSSRTTPPTPPDDGFAEFWRAYPARGSRKSGKPQAAAIWRKLTPRQREATMRALEVCSRSRDWTKSDGQYIPMPTTWLRRNPWEEDYDCGPTPPAVTQYPQWREDTRDWDTLMKQPEGALL